MPFPRKSFLPPLAAAVAVFAGTLAVAWRHFAEPGFVRVRVRLAEPVPGGVGVCYATHPAQRFEAWRRIPVVAAGTPAVAEVFVPAREICGLRIDFGSGGGEIEVLGGEVGDISFPAWDKWSFGPGVAAEVFSGGSGALKLVCDGGAAVMQVSFRRPVPLSRGFDRKGAATLLVLSLALSVAAGALYARVLEKGSGRPVAAGLSPLEWLFLFACTAWYCIWIFHPPNCSPDEPMRFAVTRFLFDHGRLPVNEETIGLPWGFSYAHRPAMFCNVFGALFMKAGALFVSGPMALLRCARALGVACAAGTVYFALRVSKLLFKTPFGRLATCFVALLPQFAYVAGYVNNDGPALFGSSLILFAWVSAAQKRWTPGLATALALGISVCATSYYNSYGWIAFSALVFPVTYRARNGRKGMAAMGLSVAGAAVCLSGCLFLRHLRLYGDPLGFETCRRFAAQYAIPEFVPGVRKSLREQGIGLWHMLFGMDWFGMTFRSVVGYFGWMEFKLPAWCYGVHAALLGAGTLGAVRKGADWILGRRGVGVCKWTLALALAGCSAVTVALSVAYSYCTDFQPQGRYCVPALLPAALLAAKGVERLAVAVLPGRGTQRAVAFALCLAQALVALSAQLLFLDLFF